MYVNIERHLLSLTKLVISIEEFHKIAVDSGFFDLQFERLKNRGILEEDFVAYMVEKFNKEQEKYGLPLTKMQAIEFAQVFGFITEVNSNTSFLEEVDQPPASDGKVFIVPAMLPLKLSDYVQLPMQG